MESGICIYLKVYNKVFKNQALNVAQRNWSKSCSGLLYLYLNMLMYLCFKCICVYDKVCKLKLSMWRRVIDQSFGLTSSNLVCFNLTSEQRRETFWIFQAEHNTKTYRDEKWYRQSFQKIYSKLLYFHIS